MNSSKNFIKLVSKNAFCLLAFVLLTACVPPSPTPNSVPPAEKAPAVASTGQKPAPAKQKSSSGLASSHRSNSNDLTGNLRWTLIDGKPKTVEDYKGKVVILDFWATYCPPCEEEIPHLVELSNKYKDDLQVVGLHVGGAEDKANIADFITKYRMIYDLGYPEQDLMDFYLQGDSRIPQTLVFDRNGQLLEQFVGFTPQIKADLDAVVQTALAQ